MKQQATAFLEHVRVEGMQCEIVMRDHAGAYRDSFENVFKLQNIQVKPVGPQAPNLNAYIERWIQSIKQEALNHFIVFGESHFNHIVREYVDRSCSTTNCSISPAGIDFDGQLCQPRFCAVVQT
jgi:putative transposase